MVTKYLAGTMWANPCRTGGIFLIAKISPESMTERESEVLSLVAQGLTNQEIGKTLFVSEATVRTHVSNILAKLHMANRVQATLYALRTGIATLGGNN